MCALVAVKARQSAKYHKRKDELAHKITHTSAQHDTVFHIYC